MSQGLKTQNLRDHMSEAELIFTALAELSTRQIAENMEATGMEENKVAGKKGGGIAKKARLDLEEKTGKKVVTTEGNIHLNSFMYEPILDMSDRHLRDLYRKVKNLS